jgi:hypothetical protein
MRGWFLLCMVLAIGLSAAASSAQDLTGRWYGEGYQLRRYLHWLAVHGADGRLQIEFREYEDCKLKERVREAGRWRLSNDILSTEIFMVEGQRVNRLERYVIQRYDATTLEYFHTRTGMPFRSQRVDEGFEWPACDPSKLVSRVFSSRLIQSRHART